MAYLAKSTVLKAYQLLSEIDSDKRQGLTQKVSALKYASALDIYFKMHNQNCDLKQSSNRDLFASYVGEIVKINDEYCTKDFFLSVSSNGRDFDCGSNFFSQTSVKDSKTNPYTVFSYPKRSGWQPVMDVQNQELIYRSDYLLDVFSFYLGSSELRLAFIIWILRFTEIAENNVDGIKSALNNMYTTDYCGALYTDSVNSVDTSYIEFDDEMCQLSCEDIQSLFNSVKGNSREESFSLNFPLQQIFYGAPGTGKSNTIKRDVEDQGKIHFRTTFHPDSDYSTFVGCYKPTLKSVKKTVVIGQDEKEVKPLTDGTDSMEQISYQFVPQAFTKAYCESWNHYNEDEESEPVYLIIEEINRGNCAQIFGDIFQLLDRKNGFSEYPIDADEDLKKFLLNGTKDDGTPWLVNKKGIENGQLRLPANLHIWATMNTSDQSLFPIDSAFKRRWDWRYIKIKDEKKSWTIEGGHDWWKFLKKINKVVLGMTSSADKQLGYFFCKANDANNEISKETFVNKVCFYLWNDVFKSFYSDEYADLFKIKKDGNDGELTFPDFFDDNGNVDSEIAEQFIGNVMKFGESQDKPTENQEAQA